MRLALALLGLGLGLAAGAARGDEDAAMGRRVQELLRTHQADVFGCVPSGGARGELLVRVMVGEAQQTARADVLKDETAAPTLSRCLVDKMRAWDLASLAASPGDQIVFPLAFTPEEVKPVRAPAPSGARVEPHVLVRGRASLTLVRLAPSVRLAQHTHPSGEAVYVLKGMVRVRQPGRPQLSLRAGEAAWFAAGVPHSLEAAPLAPAEILQIYDPPGPEDDYVSKEKKGTQVSTAKSGAPAFVAHEVKALPILGGKGEVRLLLDGSDAPLALDALSAEAGARVPPHKHDASDEILYITGGRGTTTVGGQAVAVQAGDSLRIPAGVEHSLDVDEKLTAVQVYAPGGPEQRFKK
jgi:quercetin dioxygenase-like cupin family protein